LLRNDDASSEREFVSKMTTVAVNTEFAMTGGGRLQQSNLGPGLLLGDGVQIGDGVTFGAHVVIHGDVVIGDGVTFGSHVVVHPGTAIGDNCTIQDHAILGKPPKLHKGSSAGECTAQPAQLIIESDSVICAGAIVLAGAHIHSNVLIGDQAYVRERSSIGAGSLIGRGTVVDNDVVIGERAKIQTNVYLTAFSRVEDDVFIGPCACTTNDSTMSRHARGFTLKGAHIRRAARVGGGAVICPGIEIGEEAFVAAGAVVTKDVLTRAVVMGVPARHVRDVADEDLLERWR
jgi:acetyltransferase-like isoleucine patch superfamily enzyme